MFVANESNRLRGQCHFVTAPPVGGPAVVHATPTVRARRGKAYEGDNKAFSMRDRTFLTIFSRDERLPTTCYAKTNYSRLNDGCRLGSGLCVE
jgi:hypothetical protein